MLVLYSCYKEETSIQTRDKKSVALKSITEPHRTLPVSTETQHVLSAKSNLNEGSYDYSLYYFSTLNLSYTYTEYSVSSYSSDSYFILIQDIPSDLTLIDKTDSTYFFFQSSDYYSDSVLLITKIIQPLPNDSLVLYDNFDLTLRLQEHISGFSFDSPWYHYQNGDIDFVDNKFISIWSIGDETGKVTITMNPAHNNVNNLEYLSITDFFNSTTTYKFTSSTLFLYTMDSASIIIGYSGPYILEDNYFSYNKYPSDTTFSRSYYANEDSYFFVELKKD